MKKNRSPKKKIIERGLSEKFKIPSMARLYNLKNEYLDSDKILSFLE